MLQTAPQIKFCSNCEPPHKANRIRKSKGGNLRPRCTGLGIKHPARFAADDSGLLHGCNCVFGIGSHALGIGKGHSGAYSRRFQSHYHGVLGQHHGHILPHRVKEVSRTFHILSVASLTKTMSPLGSNICTGI